MKIKITISGNTHTTLQEVQSVVDVLDGLRNKPNVSALNIAVVLTQVSNLIKNSLDTRNVGCPVTLDDLMIDLNEDDKEDIDLEVAENCD